MTRAKPEWRRFSIAEALILVGAFCVGYAVSRSATDIYDAILGGSVGGLAIGGPFVLLFQATVRGRRSALSAGELLWVLPGVIFVGILLTSRAFKFIGVSEDFVFTSVAAGGLIAATATPFTAIIILARTATGSRQGIQCKWTDISGCFLGPLCILLAIFAFLRGVTAL